jgi:transcriptional regulator with XRE-family HTH domain
MIKAFREANKINVKALAKVIGVSYDALWRFEQGKPIHIRHYTTIVRWVLTA